MIKLVVFDLDGTLAEVGRGTTMRTAEYLQNLELGNIRIAISSGKPVFYLAGFARQLDLADPILIGENGAVIQYGLKLPPVKIETMPMDESGVAHLAVLKEKVKKTVNGIWFQPNDVGLTCFFYDEEQKRRLRQFFQREVSSSDGLTVYEHVDSFDVTPKGIDKKQSLIHVLNELQIHPDEAAAIGNGVNDYPMFEAVGWSAVIGTHPSGKATVIVDDIETALQRLLEKINQPQF